MFRVGSSKKAQYADKYSELLKMPLYWTLDVTFREDDCRIRDGNATLTMTWLEDLFCAC